jgi:hypothetical protein
MVVCQTVNAPPSRPRIKEQIVPTIILSLFLHHILQQQPCNALGSYGKDRKPKVKVVHGREADGVVESKIGLRPYDYGPECARGSLLNVSPWTLVEKCGRRRNPAGTRNDLIQRPEQVWI